MMSRMPFGHYHTHAGNQFSFSVHKLPLVHMRDRRKVFAPVTRARALVRPRRLFVLAALHKVFGSRERRDYCSVLPNRVAAGMIEVQMCVDDHVNVFGLKALHLQGIPKRRNPLHGEYLLKLRVLFIAQTGIDKNILSPCTNEQAVETKRNAVLLIWLTAFLPQNLWNYAEHGPAIQPKAAVRHRLNIKRPEFHVSHSPKPDRTAC